MKRTDITVRSTQTEGGAPIPAVIQWPDGRSWNITRVIHICASAEGEYPGVRYTVMIGKREKYLYRDAAGWYVMA